MKPFHRRTFVIIGSGNREAAFALRLAQEWCNVVMIPGNAAYHFGKDKISYVSPLHEPVDPYGYVMYMQERKNLACVVVGPEAFLEMAVVDRWRAAGIPVVGPTRANAELELSKWFFHSVAQKLRFRVPRTSNAGLDDNYAKYWAFGMLQQYGSVVVKVDGLTGAQGVRVCRSEREIIEFVDFAAKHLREGKWKGWFLIQQPITGREVSYLAIAGANGVFHELSNFRDHKLTPDGRMCGGMGGFSPVPDVTDRHMRYFRNSVVRPTLDLMHRRVGPYIGFIFVGGIIDTDGMLWILEWNARMGDPEAMGILGQLKTPLWWLLRAAVEGQHIDVEFHNDRKTGVMVLAAPGYPGPIKTFALLQNVSEMLARYPEVQFVPGGLSCASSTAGGRIEDLRVESGRALALVCSANSWHSIETSLFSAADMLRWEDARGTRTYWRPFVYRTDMFSGLVQQEESAVQS